MSTQESEKRKKLTEKPLIKNKRRYVDSCMMGWRSWLRRKMIGFRKLKSNRLSIFLYLRSKNMNKLRVCEKEMERAA